MAEFSKSSPKYLCLNSPHFYFILVPDFFIFRTEFNKQFRNYESLLFSKFLYNHNHIKKLVKEILKIRISYLEFFGIGCRIR